MAVPQISHSSSTCFGQVHRNCYLSDLVLVARALSAAMLVFPSQVVVAIAQVHRAEHRHRYQHSRPSPSAVDPAQVVPGSVPVHPSVAFVRLCVSPVALSGWAGTEADTGIESAACPYLDG